MANERSTILEWLTTEDAISLLDAPHREAPSLIDTARAPFALGLLLVALFMVLAGIGGMVHAVMQWFHLPAW